MWTDKSLVATWGKLALRATRSLVSKLRLFGQCLLLGCALTPFSAIGQVPDFAETLVLAETGNARAQFNLGLMYYIGAGVPEDNVEAVKWYRLAAGQGHAAAQLNFGLMYSNGEGLPQDNEEATRWFRLAADQGDALAQFNLGLHYMSGEGVSQDDAEALRWFRLAADQGHANAQSAIGSIYAFGSGVPIDYVTAYAWFNVAAVFGLEQASNLRSNVEESMTSDQITEAQQLSIDIFERIQGESATVE
mgnify:FL=1